MTSVCPYFGMCGGCAYQDLNDAAYTELKQRFIQNALQHEGIDFPLSPMVRIGTGTRRRATFAYRGGVLGFNARRSHEIIPITTCPMLTPTLEKFMQALKSFVHSCPGAGDIAVLMTNWGADVSVIPEKAKDKWKSRKKTKPLTEDVFFLESVNVFCRENQVARFLWNGILLYQATPLPFPPNVFMQPSVEGEKALVELVLKGCANSEKVLDLFCGLGTFTKPLHKAGKKVKGMDITAESIAALRHENIDAEARDLFRAPMMADELLAYDTVVLDPARAGAKEQSIQIAANTLKQVVMVSCNPITFARDCHILLDAGFHFEWIVPVDQFTFTQHIEVVALLRR